MFGNNSGMTFCNIFWKYKTVIPPRENTTSGRLPGWLRRERGSRSWSCLVSYCRSSRGWWRSCTSTTREGTGRSGSTSTTSLAWTPAVTSNNTTSTCTSTWSFRSWTSGIRSKKLKAYLCMENNSPGIIASTIYLIYSLLRINWFVILIYSLHNIKFICKLNLQLS